MTPEIIVILVIMGIVILFGIAITIISMNRKKHSTFLKSFRKKLNRFCTGLYKALRQTPLVKSIIERTTLKISKLSVYNSSEIPAVVIKTIFVAALWSLALICAGVFLFNDIITKILCFAFASVLFSNVIENRIDKITINVLKQTKLLLSSIQLEYMKTKNIPNAIADSKPGNLVKIAVDEILAIITGSNGETRLQQFYASMSFRPLQTLASVCYNLSDYGDTVDNTGISSFVKAITILREDVNSQLEKIETQKSMFSKLVYLPILSVFLITPTEMYFTSLMPGMAMMYNGVLGFVLRALTIITAIVGYMVTSRINRTVTVKADDRGEWTEALLKHKVWQNFIRVFYPKKLITRGRLKNVIKKSLSKMKLSHFYTKKIVFAVVAFFAAIAVTIAACVIGRDFAKNTTAQLSMASGVERSEEQLINMRIMDAIFFEANGEMYENELTALIKTYLPGLTDMEMQDEMTRIRNKYDLWADTYFKFYYLLIAFALGIIGYFVPNFMLKGRAYFVKNEAQDDFMQIQTLVGIMLNTNVDTLEILRQMARHSTVHKDLLQYAYHSFPSAPEQELEWLKTKLTIPEFRIFIDKLKMSISEVSLTDAFSDLITERQHLLRLQELTFKATLSKKKFLCKILSFLPLVMYVLAEFLIPMLTLGMNEFFSSTSAMNALMPPM